MCNKQKKWEGTDTTREPQSSSLGPQSSGDFQGGGRVEIYLRSDPPKTP